jgi:hypothetical protein
VYALQSHGQAPNFSVDSFLNPVYQAVVGRSEDKEQRKQQKQVEKHKGANLEVGASLRSVQAEDV